MKDNSRIQSSNPLYLYEDLLQHGGINRLYESFLLDAEMLSGTFKSAKRIEFEFIEQEVNSNNELMRLTESFTNKLKPHLEKAYSFGTFKLSERLSELRTSNERRDLLTHILDASYHLYQNLETVETHDQVELSQNFVKKFITYINEKYFSFGISHIAFSLLPEIKNEIIGSGFFKFKYKRSGIKRLYNVLKDLGFLSDDPADEVKLKNIITSDDPQSLNTPIKISCTVQKASYIFFKMQELFYDFSFKNIEASKSFQTPHGKYFIANSISGSKKKFLDSVDESQNDIDDAFRVFLN